MSVVIGVLLDQKHLLVASDLRRLNGSKVVNDSTTKLFRINKDVVIGITGSYEFGMEWIGFLENICAGDPVDKLLARIAQQYETSADDYEDRHPDAISVNPSTISVGYRWQGALGFWTCKTTGPSESMQGHPRCVQYAVCSTDSIIAEVGDALEKRLPKIRSVDAAVGIVGKVIRDVAGHQKEISPTSELVRIDGGVDRKW